MGGIDFYAAMEIAFACFHCTHFTCGKSYALCNTGNLPLDYWTNNLGSAVNLPIIGHFTVVYLVAKPLIWSEAEGDLVVLETRI